MHKYEVVSESIINDIRTKKYKVGEKLPSINKLAEKYDVSKSTIISALNILESKHVIFTKDRSGHFVTTKNSVDPEYDYSSYNLSTGNPRVDTFPVERVAHAMNLSVGKYKSLNLQYKIEGRAPLRKTLKNHLERSWIITDLENLFLSQSIIQVLLIFVKIPFPNNKHKILIESPTFSFAVNLLKDHNQEVITINRDENGIDLKELEHIFSTQPIKFFYIIPRNHNPLGTYLTTHQRKEIMRLAHKYDVFIIEDDYFADCYEIPKYNPIYYYSDFKNCVYLQSYSKFFPFIRIGFAIVPDRLIENFSEGMRMAYYSSYSPAMVSQTTLEVSIQSGIIKETAETISDDLHEKNAILKRVTQKWDKKIINPITQYTGLYSLYKISDDIDMDQFIEEALEQNIMLKSAKKSFYEETPDKYFRISLARIKSEDLELVLNLIIENATNLRNNVVQRQKSMLDLDVEIPGGN